MLALLHEGRDRPSVDEVASRAGVSAASVFRYFDGLDELHRQAFELQLEQITPLLHISGFEQASFEDRVASFVHGRLDVYEQVAGVARMGRRWAADHPVFAESLDRARRLWLQQVRDVFAEELSTRGRTTRGELAALVDTVTSFEAWDLLHRSHQLSRRSIDLRWRDLVACTLGADR